MFDWLSKRKFQAHLTAFLLMVISSFGMILFMQVDSTPFIWLLIAIFAMANILATLIK